MADLLIVDDDTDAAAALAEILREEGHEVRLAFDGETGLRRLDEKLPDLVLLDVEMPILGGPAMAQRMLLLDCGRERIPVVLLSGVPDVGEVAARVGTPYHLGKPYRFEWLKGLLERALTERTPPHASEAPPESAR